MPKPPRHLPAALTHLLDAWAACTPEEQARCLAGIDAALTVKLRDHAQLVEQLTALMRAGAGITTPRDTLYRSWHEVSDKERLHALIELTTPAERRALAGIEDAATQAALRFRLARGQQVQHGRTGQRGTVEGRGCNGLVVPALHSYWVRWQDGAEGWSDDAELIAVEEEAMP